MSLNDLQIPTRVCPTCGSEGMIDGVLGMTVATFRPSSMSAWVNFRGGFTLKGRACLQCGLVLHYLSPQDLLRIRKSQQ
jgi:hypothetical protein